MNVSLAMPILSLSCILVDYFATPSSASFFITVSSAACLLSTIFLLHQLVPFSSHLDYTQDPSFHWDHGSERHRKLSRPCGKFLLNGSEARNGTGEKFVIMWREKCTAIQEVFFKSSDV